jgi:membrane-bound metal-dependent hydrolase YbcI (DUF457 family)
VFDLTGDTHRAFSVTFAVGGAYALSAYGISTVHPLVSAPVLLLAARYGALLPDVDHHWSSVAEKTVPNRIINGFIHLTGGKHRSWQTHSWDIYLLLLAILVFFPRAQIESIGLETAGVLYMLLYGVMLGWGSHMFSDMLTPQGVRLTCFSKFKVRLVPKWAVFATDSRWEDICYNTIRVINVLAGLAYLAWCAITLGWV